MAHGSPRIDICHTCQQYILVPRFSEDPICPTCQQPSVQSSKEKIREQYSLSFFYEFKLNFDHWEKINK